MSSWCVLRAQGYEPCNCFVEKNGVTSMPCKAGLKISRGEIYRLIYDAVLSRPEDYFSIYQSCCNHNCLKCHSWYFAQVANGRWMSPRDVLNEVLKYAESITFVEPRERSTMWHASDLCSHCGACVYTGSRGRYCPGKLRQEQVVWSPQGYGPARNIISFTGGDLYCQPAFYAKTFRLIKREAPGLWIHIETNGYGLAKRNLEVLYEAGLDSIWLDMKAYSEDVYRFLCGTSNKHVLELPALVKDIGILLEIVLLYIPGFVELNEMERFAEHISSVDKSIPVTLLAFLPEYKLRHLREPTIVEIINAYRALKSKLSRVKIGNVGVFCKTYSCIDYLIKEVGREAIAL